MAKDKSKKASKKSAAIKASGGKVVKLKKVSKKAAAFSRGIGLVKDAFLRVQESSRPPAAWVGASSLASAFGRKKVGKKALKKITKGLVEFGTLQLHIFEHNLSKTSKGFGLVALDSVMANHIYAVGDPDHKNRVDHMHMQEAAADASVKVA